MDCEMPPGSDFDVFLAPSARESLATWGPLVRNFDVCFVVVFSGRVLDYVFSSILVPKRLQNK